jgi:hypothetical protein
LLADREPADHGIHRGHGVVDQQRQRDDQGAERDPLQVDAGDLHDREDDRDRERDRERDHRACPDPERHEAGRENDDDRLPERRHEVVDGEIDRDRLVGHQRRLDADRQLCPDRCHGRLDIAAELQDVAALAHGDREADRRLAVDAEHGLRRVDIAAADLGDVAQADDPVAGDEVDREQVGLGLERAGDPQEQPLVAGLHHAGGADDVLRLQRRGQLREVQLEPGQALGREFQEDLLVLGAEELDLGNVRDLQEPRADVLDRVTQLALGEAVRGEPVDDAERVAEIVVEERSDDAGGQRVTDVGDALAHVVPAIRHFGGRRVLAQIDEDDRPPGDGEAAQLVEAAHLLQLALDPLGHLQQGLVERGTGPAGRDDHGPEGERRVLVAAEADEGEGAGDDGRDHEEADQRAPSDRPFGQVGPDQAPAPSSRTCWPGRSAWTPAVTTMSPGSSPLPTTTTAGSCRWTSIGRSETVVSAGSTTQTAGRPSARVRAEAGTTMPAAVSSCMRPVTVEPRRMAAGGSTRPTLISNVPVVGSARGAISRT